MDRSQQPTSAPSTPHTPPRNQAQPNRILAEPATVDACRADYKAGATAREAMDKRSRGAR